MKANFFKRSFIFKTKAGTSRGVLHQKLSWFLKLESKGKTGFGECSILPKLSLESDVNLDLIFEEICQDIDLGVDALMTKWSAFPAVKFCIEMAFRDLEFGGQKQFFDSDFYAQNQGIQTNGLIWMGEKHDMIRQIKAKIEAGFQCIKIKIGAIGWRDELDVIASIRKEFSKQDIEIRVDANGGFSYPAVNLKLDQLSRYHIHSIEQPIATGNWKSMERLCRNSPIPIALDEELIAIRESSKRRELLKIIKPQYIILKPSLLGGLKDSDDWIQLAEKENVKWWATSALESNIGLNAIAQWASTKALDLPQGLGTGLLFTNNIESPLELRGEDLFHTSKAWANPEN